MDVTLPFVTLPDKPAVPVRRSMQSLGGAPDTNPTTESGMADEPANPTIVSCTEAASSAPDAELAKRLRAGDFAAFTRVYDQLAAPAYALAYRLVGDAGQAEDTVQEVLLSLWERPERYDPSRAALRTWVLSAVHHRAVDRLRRRATHPQTSLDAPRSSATAGNGWGDGGVTGNTPLSDMLQGASGNDPAERAERSERASAVRQALAALPVHQRDALLLAYYGGLTQQQVAAHLHEPLGTIKTRVRLALAKLRTLLAAFDERAAEAPDPRSTREPRQQQEGGYPRGNG